MKVLIAPDKFKGSLSARQVAQNIAAGLGAGFTTTLLPLADGGDGTLDVLLEFTQGRLIEVVVNDPLFRPITSVYGISGDGKTAIIEMARASGLMLLQPDERNPMYTTTYGTGQLIRHALDQGVEEIVLAIGGSATNDAGIGMAAALGYKFEDASGQLLSPVGEQLVNLHNIKTDQVHPRISKTRFIVLCDVDNVLYGVHGAAWMFGPQKGADQKSILQLDEGLIQFDKVVTAIMGMPCNFPGAGAAGGMGAGAYAFLHAISVRGFDYIAERTDIDKAISNADVVITGEGHLDAQTLSGKVVHGVSERCNKFGKICVAIVGRNSLPENELQHLGLARTFALVKDGQSEQEAVDLAAGLVRQLVGSSVAPWLLSL